MKLVNRGFIKITPTETFIAWAKTVAEETPFFDNKPEPTIYLIEDDFWEDEKIVEKYFKKIVKQEFGAIEEDKENQPQIADLELFHVYFQSELGTFVYDLLNDSLQSEKV
jgi:hypothetical protein